MQSVWGIVWCRLYTNRKSLRCKNWLFDNIIYSGKKAVVRFDIRLVDNRTGKIIFAEIVGGSKTVAKELGGLDGTASISEAVNDAAKEVIKLLNEKNPLTGNVAHVTDSQVFRPWL